MNEPHLPGCFPFPTAQTFTGQFVSLTPLEVSRDVNELFAISHADDARELWRYLPCGPFASVDAYTAFLREWQAQPHVIVFTVRDVATRLALGSISLMEIRANHGVAELGNIWYAPPAQRTRANTETCHLLLRHCFETLGYRRLEWKCNALNVRSHRAALRLGFVYEGTFRQHMIVKGRNRDTAWFSILDHEWPGVRAAQRRWLDGDASASLSPADRPTTH